MVEIVSVLQMKEIEENAMALGIPAVTLMENAGYASYETVLNCVGLASRNCLVFCGNGNNGGDGLVFARYAQDAGANVTVILVGGYPKSTAAIENMEKVKEMNIPVLSADFNQYAIQEALGSVDIIIDAVYGTGFHGELQPKEKALFGKIHSAVAAVFSLDIPSGIECDSGHCAEGCIKADFTISFDSTKPCHILPQSIPNCGSVHVVDIGIPDKARKGLFVKATLLTELHAKSVLPQRTNQGNKSTFGRVVNIAGSGSYPGAAVLSSKGAAAAGAGYVTLVSTQEVCQIVACHIPEVLHIQLSSNNGACNLLELVDTTSFYQKANVISMGCGLGCATGIQELLEQLIVQSQVALVVDADGIAALKEILADHASPQCPIVMTPHPGEMARFLGCTIEEVEKDRYQKALKLAQYWNMVVVLKGYNTLVVHPSGEVFINAVSNSGLSKAGSGDLLTGLISGFMAQGATPFDAATLGVYVHSSAAKLCSQRMSAYTMQPSDMVQEIGQVLCQLQNKKGD